MMLQHGTTGYRVIFEDHSSERLQRSHVVLEELLCQVLFFATGHQGQETHPLGVAQVRMLPCIALVSTISVVVLGNK